MKSNNQVMQFKITLNDLKPLIWRRIQVPADYSFWDLHVAIQDSMGWLDYHLHEFELTDHVFGQKTRFGIPEDGAQGNLLPGWEYQIAPYFYLEKTEAVYEYDFGDGWVHTVLFEKMINSVPKRKYPFCAGGKRTCPPEDCGGAHEYSRLLKVMKNPASEDYEELMDWLGDKFDPEHFDPLQVVFFDPKDRLEMAFGK